jgi:hypothetical protein
MTEKKPRKKYKALYLAEQSRHETTKHKLQRAQRRLEEINAALVPFGQQTLKSMGDGEGPINLSPLPFVASRAFMEGNARILVGEDDYADVQGYSWRGRPIHKTGEPGPTSTTGGRE